METQIHFDIDWKISLMENRVSGRVDDDDDDVNETNYRKNDTNRIDSKLSVSVEEGSLKSSFPDK